jgi:SRSO17 transposase
MQGLVNRVSDPARYQSLQHFITHSTWSADDVWSTLRKKAVDDHGVLVIDDTGIPKQGRDSVGVARQYSGTLGKIGNCQIVVSCVLHTARSTWPMAMDLYLPEEWMEDEARRESVGIPESIFFRPKWKIALDQVDALLRQGITIDAVVADAAYGSSSEFREGLASRKQNYVVGINNTTTVFLDPDWPSPSGFEQQKAHPVRMIAYLLPAEAWQKVTWRKGTKGPLAAEFARIRVMAAREGRESSPCWLLMERPLSGNGDRKYYLSNLPKDVPLRTLVDRAHQRWCVELNYQQLKSELALDHFEGRQYAGFHRHLVLTALAFFFLEKERRRHRSKPLPTLNAMRRLVTDIVIAIQFATGERFTAMVKDFARSPPNLW